MKKKLTIIVGFIALFMLSIYTVKAVNPENLNAAVHVTKTGESDHANVEVRIDPAHLEDEINESGYLADVLFYTDPGYYVKSLSVKLGETDLELGFEAASEQGMFFRRTPFYPGLNEYQFYLPNAADEDNKVVVTVEVAERTPFDIIYKNYTGTDNDYNNFDNYGEEHVLVQGYKDGDLVLTNDCIEHGCLVEFRFADEESYNEYKNSPQRVEGNNPPDPWYRASAVNLTNNDETFQAADCDDEGRVCKFIVTEEFNNVLLGNVHIGYTDINVFSPNYLGFDVETDVANFQDVLFETGNGAIGFDENNLETSITLFYGTRELRLIKKAPKAVVSTGANNCASLDSFDDVTGEGYGYSTAYDNASGVVTVSIDSYYQDKMNLELTLKKNGNNIFGDNKVKIELKRFAFGGNALSVLEVDSTGRNCNEANNGNTCDQGVYYSVQYRGVQKVFYVAEDAVTNEHFSNFYDVTSFTGTAITLQLDNDLRVTPRDKNFQPHAVALYYDEDGMIIESRVFDLNSEVYQDGLVSKETFLAKHGDKERNIEELAKDFIFFSANLPIPAQPMIEDIEYFAGSLENAFMHDMILISKAEAEEKGIKKITLFLVNGEVDEENIPELTFGTGEGVVLEIRGND